MWPWLLIALVLLLLPALALYVLGRVRTGDLRVVPAWRAGRAAVASLTGRQRLLFLLPLGLWYAVFISVVWQVIAPSPREGIAERVTFAVAMTVLFTGMQALFAFRSHSEDMPRSASRADFVRLGVVLMVCAAVVGGGVLVARHLRPEPTVAFVIHNDTDRSVQVVVVSSRGRGLELGSWCPGGALPCGGKQSHPKPVDPTQDARISAGTDHLNAAFVTMPGESALRCFHNVDFANDTYRLWVSDATPCTQAH